ncbi:MAG TPA: hypothetical protein HPP66_05160 [Planctomycetes bacterium]|nr:hypothetical protein [Planctomycetota bacterium]
MVKRIPCRIVRSKALGKSSNALRQVSTSNNAYQQRSDVVTRPPKSYKSASRTLTYTDLLEITRASIDDGLTGQILDCYA